MKKNWIIIMATMLSISMNAQDLIQLLPPQTKGGMPLMEALANRKTNRDFTQDELTPQQLSNLLWAAAGVNRPDGRRTAPTARNAQQIEKSHNGTFQSSTANQLAGRYSVSRNTILRDAKVAAAIDTMGESSPEAKRMTLSGEVVLSRKLLVEISSMADDEIAEIALQIESGTFETPKTEAPEDIDAPDHSFPEDAQPLDAVITEITDEFFSQLRGSIRNNDIEGSKIALRTYIDMLEALYSTW
jgi:hypothetical protein